MDVEKAPFLSAAERVGISPDAADALWATLAGAAVIGTSVPASSGAQPAAAQPAAGGFSVANVAYYFGGFIVIGAMTFFMTLGWQNAGGPFIFFVSLLYAAILGGLGWFLYRREGSRTPGGILVTAAVCMVPLAIYGFQDWHHLWLDGDPGTYSRFYVLIHGSWMWMEIGTIVASLAALWFVRFPLLTLPIAFALWFLSMDVTSAIFGKHDDAGQIERLALIFGLAMLAISIWLDRSGHRAYAFWTYAYGTLTLFGGLAILWNGEPGEALFAVICLIAGLASIVLQRRVLIVFAALGIAAYLGHLAWDVFNNSILFPFALTIVGLAIVGAGIMYQRKEAAIRTALLSLLPEA